MWRKRIGSIVQGNRSDVGSEDDEGMSLERHNQSNQSTPMPDPHLENLVKAARAAKEYIDERFDTVTSESRSSSKALSQAVNQVYVDQVVLKENLGAHLHSMEAAALGHIDSVAKDLRQRHDAALRVLEDCVNNFTESSAAKDTKVTASIHANEIGIVACQRALNTRIDDLETSSTREIKAIRVAIEDMSSDLPQRVLKLEESIERIPSRFADLETCVQGLPSRILQLEECVSGYCERITKVEESVGSVPVLVHQLEDRVENVRNGGRRTSERVDHLAAASEQAIATAVSRMSSRIERVDQSYLKPLEDSKHLLVEMIEGVAKSAKTMLEDVETRLLDITVPRAAFVETAALAASLQDKVSSHGEQLVQLTCTASTPTPALSNGARAQLPELTNLRSTQHDQAQLFAALRGVVEQQGQLLLAQGQEIANLRAVQTTLRTAHDSRCGAVEANAAGLVHASQALEALRSWADTKLSQQERHCAAIRETCSDLEQSLDSRLDAWFRRESEILALRLRAESFESDGTDISEVEHGPDAMEDDDSQPEPPQHQPTNLPADPSELRAVRLEREVRLRATRLASERVGTTNTRLLIDRRDLERQISEIDQALQSHAQTQFEDSLQGGTSDPRAHHTHALHEDNIDDIRLSQLRELERYAREASERRARQVREEAVFEAALASQRLTDDRLLEMRLVTARRARESEDRDRQIREASEQREYEAREERMASEREGREEAVARANQARINQAQDRARQVSDTRAQNAIRGGGRHPRGGRHTQAPPSRTGTSLQRTDRREASRVSVEMTEREDSSATGDERQYWREARQSAGARRGRSRRSRGAGSAEVRTNATLHRMSELDAARAAAQELVQARANARSASLRR